MDRILRNKLTLLKPNIQQRILTREEDAIVNSCNTKIRTFTLGEKVLARNYSNSVKWIPGVVTKITGPVSYEVEVDGGTIRRHVDQIIPFKEFHNNKEELRSNFDMDFEHSNIMAERTVSPPTQLSVEANLPTEPTRAPNQPSVETNYPIESTRAPNILPDINGNPCESEVTNDEGNIQREEGNSRDIIEAPERSTRKSTRIRNIPDRYQAGFG